MSMSENESQRNHNGTGDPPDSELVPRAQQGDRDALEQLVRRYQSWIYNVALRMVWVPEDAQDVTQEVLIKVLTKLSTFRGECAFRTWLYRIMANHVLNMKKRSSELRVVSFEEYAGRINACPDDALPDPSSVPVPMEILVEESKLACMTGMLLCLDREQRLIFILGAMFDVGDQVGSGALGITPENFRQKLSRARRDLHSFMMNQCGLVNPANPCRCAKKTSAYIKYGVVDPTNLRFYRSHVRAVREKVAETGRRLENWIELFRDHPFQEGPDFVASVREALQADGLV